MLLMFGLQDKTKKEVKINFQEMKKRRRKELKHEIH